MSIMSAENTAGTKYSPETVRMSPLVSRLSMTRIPGSSMCHASPDVNGEPFTETVNGVSVSSIMRTRCANERQVPVVGVECAIEIRNRVVSFKNVSLRFVCKFVIIRPVTNCYGPPCAKRRQQHVVNFRRIVWIYGKRIGSQRHIADGFTPRNSRLTLNNRRAKRNLHDHIRADLLRAVLECPLARGHLHHALHLRGGHISVTGSLAKIEMLGDVCVGALGLVLRSDADKVRPAASVECNALAVGRTRAADIAIKAVREVGIIRRCRCRCQFRRGLRRAKDRIAG